MNHVINGQFYKGIMRKFSISWLFSYIIPSLNSVVKKFGSHDMPVLYPKRIITMYVTKGLLLFDLILFIPVNIFQSCWDRSSKFEPVLISG